MKKVKKETVSHCGFYELYEQIENWLSKGEITLISSKQIDEGEMYIYKTEKTGQIWELKVIG